MGIQASSNIAVRRVGLRIENRQERGDTACKNSIKFLQYYCSNFDEKMGYSEVKTGNKK